jgi:hypothetical protein
MFALLLVFAVNNDLIGAELPPASNVLIAEKCRCRATGECSCDVCRCPQYSAPPGGWPVSTPVKPAAPKKLTGDPRIDGGMYVRTCQGGRCTSRWVPLAELPEFARRPVMQVPADKSPAYVPQRRSLFRWR